MSMAIVFQKDSSILLTRLIDPSKPACKKNLDKEHAVPCPPELLENVPKWLINRHKKNVPFAIYCVNDDSNNGSNGRWVYCKQF